MCESPDTDYLDGSQTENADWQTQFLLDLTDDSLFRTLARVHTAAGEGEIMLPVAVTFDEGEGVILDEDGGGADSQC
jgi:hypothetical protein